VSYNRAEDLRLALDAILAWTDVTAEVLVVDNASTDAAPDVAASFGERVRLVRNRDNAGFAAACNQGLALATGDYVALVNNDAVTEPGWAAALVAFLDAKDDAAAAGGKQYFWDARNPLGARTNRYWAHAVLTATAATPLQPDAPDGVREVATLSGAAVLVRRRAIDDVGTPFLDPSYFMYYEETDFFARAVRRGWRLFYTGTPAVWHRGPAPDGRIPFRVHFHLARNRVLFAHRQLGDAALARIRAKVRAKARAAAVKQLVSRDEKYRAHAEAWRWVKEHDALLREHRAAQAAVGPWLDEVLAARGLL